MLVLLRNCVQTFTWLFAALFPTFWKIQHWFLTYAIIPKWLILWRKGQTSLCSFTLRGYSTPKVHGRISMSSLRIPSSFSRFCILGASLCYFKCRRYLVLHKTDWAFVEKKILRSKKFATSYFSARTSRTKFLREIEISRFLLNYIAHKLIEKEIASRSRVSS